MKLHIRALLFSTLLLAGVVSAEIPEYPLVRVDTSAGSFTLELDRDRAPLSVSNFLQYVDNGHYADTIFHRVIGSFVAQGGGYTVVLGEDGARTINKKEAGETIPNESGNGLSNRRGTVAMARTGDPHSADAQFYINLADNLSLDPKPTRWGYTVFGKVVEGMDIIDDIGHSATGPGGTFTNDVPVEDIVIDKMTLLGAEDAG